MLSFSISVSFAYQATDQDLADLNLLKAQFMEVIGQNNEDLRDYYYQLKVLNKQYSFDERLSFMISDLEWHLRTQMQNRKQIAKILSKEHKEAFLLAYKDEITHTETIQDNCIGRYNTLDDIAFSHNYPTSLLIWTRYRETTCGYYLPSNTRGPFQITSRNYGTGEITEELFVLSVIDFINFSKNKYSRYEGANSASWLIVEVSYTGLTYTGVVRHGGLYNWLSGYTAYGPAQPLNPAYVFDRYTDQYSGAIRYGILPQTLKILERELQNKY